MRAVRVRGRWAWIPGGGPPLRSGFHPQPPILVLKIEYVMFKSSGIERNKYLTTIGFVSLDLKSNGMICKGLRSNQSKYFEPSGLVNLA